jgi:hypothetical protein
MSIIFDFATSIKSGQEPPGAASDGYMPFYAANLPFHLKLQETKKMSFNDSAFYVAEAKTQKPS